MTELEEVVCPRCEKDEFYPYLIRNSEGNIIAVRILCKCGYVMQINFGQKSIKMIY